MGHAAFESGSPAATHSKQPEPSDVAPSTRASFHGDDEEVPSLPFACEATAMGGAVCSGNAETRESEICDEKRALKKPGGTHASQTMHKDGRKYPRGARRDKTSTTNAP
jgi:hypothetical protein